MSKPIPDAMDEVQDQLHHWHFFDEQGLFEHGVHLNLISFDLFGYHIAISKFKILMLVVAISLKAKSCVGLFGTLLNAYLLTSETKLQSLH
jgi:hypothetical protein